jgi:MraZ protein
VFVGEYYISFLGKGRIALPKKIRNLLSGSRVVLTRGFENCIFGYEKKSWEEASEKQIETPVTEEKGRVIRRYLFSGAMVAKFDSQGRVVIPQFLLEYAKIGQKVAVIGAGDHFEIWNADLWQKELGLIENKKFK